MKKRILNPWLLAFSLLGGAVGWAAGEWILGRWEGRLHETLLMGLYWGQFALFIGLGALAGELISPQLNGSNWRLRYASDSWKLLVPGTLVLLFAGGALFQWLYGFTMDIRQVPRDYVLLLDISDSMKQNDPGKESLHAAQLLIQKMDTHTRLGVMTFNHNTAWVQKLTELRSDQAKQELAARLGQAAEPNGETDIGKALTAAVEGLREAGTPPHQGTVLLFSDGYSPMDIAQVTAPYTAQGFQIHTVSLEAAGQEGGRLLQGIAAATGGTFQPVQSADHLTEAFDNIYTAQNRWHLMGERQGSASGYYAVLRVLLLGLIGTLLGLSLGIVFDNRFLAGSFTLGGTVAGLLAGALLESGLPSHHPAGVRLEADLLLALVLGLSTVLFAVKQGGTHAGLRGGGGRAKEAYGRSGEESGRGQGSRSGRRFS